MNKREISNVPVPKINIINYCTEWIGICSNFGDIEDQKKVWFRSTGSEIGSFSDEFARIDFVLNVRSDGERKKYFNKECYDLIENFLKNLYKFREDPQTDFILADEEQLYSDPRWLMVVKSAQEAKTALENYLQEVNK